MAGVAIGEERVDIVGQVLEVVLVPGWYFVDGAGPGRSVGDGQHFAGVVTDIGEVAVEDAVVDHHG